MSKSKNDTIGAVVCALAGMNPKYVGLMSDVANRLNQPNGDATAWHALISNVIKQGLPKPEPKSITRLISDHFYLTLPPTTGKRTIAQAGDVFTGGIDSHFTSRGLDLPGVQTEVTRIAVHEIVRNGKFKDIFADLTQWFTQDQVITFVECYAKWLRLNGWGILLPFAVSEERFVADVHRYSDKATVVQLYRLEEDFVWGAADLRRVVLPQLTTSVTQA